jgi:hypothetical protein
MLRVPGRLPLKDDATQSGGRRPRSLRGGNRGPTRWKGSSRLDWVTVGGESGSKALPMHPGLGAKPAGGVPGSGNPFFFKQIGQWTWIQPERKRRAIGLMPDGRQVEPGTPGSITMWNGGKKAAGNQLDGKVWEQMPKGCTPPRPKRAARKKKRKRTRKKRPAGKRPRARIVDEGERDITAHQRIALQELMDGNRWPTPAPFAGFAIDAEQQRINSLRWPRLVGGDWSDDPERNQSADRQLDSNRSQQDAEHNFGNNQSGGI